MASIRTLTNASELARAAAEMVVRDLSAAIAEYGDATWVIAGGSTPLLAYKQLAASATSAMDWSKVNVIIGDERCVSFDSPDANWSQAHAALLQYLPLSDSVVRPATNLSAEFAADSYDAYLRQLPRNDRGLPRFDHVWLGVGEDGHTLSLFPNHPSSAETTADKYTDDGASLERLVIAVHDSPKPPPDRISLTFRALQGTRNCLIIAAGSSKAAVLERALGGDTSLPVAKAAQVVDSSGGHVTWLLDAAAAGA